MADVFISYARSTAKHAQAIGEALRALGYSVWRDDDLPSHRAYADVIQEQLGSAKAVVVIWSAEAVKSQWVRSEADRARGEDKLVQLCVDQARLPMPFDQIHCADLAGWSGDPNAPGWRGVVAGIGDLVGEVAAMKGPPPRVQAGGLAVPDKPSIAVLPFTDMTGEKSEDYFIDGMVDEIVTALSRFPTLFVIANSSTLAYRAEARNLRQIAGELGVRYLLEGGVRKAGEKVRISVRLSDAIENLSIWAERFDGTMDDVFTLQETLASSVAGQIEPSIEASEISRASSKPTQDLGAYDLYLRAIHLRRRIDKDAALAALDLLEQAIARDAEFGLALALASHIHSRNFLFAWSGDRERSRRTATDLAHRALQSCDNDPRVIGWAAWAMSNVGADPRTVESMTKRALELNPNSADLWIYTANVNMWAGRAELAMSQFETAARLDPRSPDRPLILGGIGTCLMLQRRYEEAVSAYSEATELRPQYAPGQAGLAACYAHLGRMVEARKALAAVDPMVIPTLLNLFQDPETREFLRSTLAKAGAGV